MTKTKVRTRDPKSSINFRVPRCDFEYLCNIATADRRSCANLVEKIVVEWLTSRKSLDKEQEEGRKVIERMAENYELTERRHR